MLDGRVLAICLLVGIFFASLYGVFATVALARASRASTWRRRSGVSGGEASTDVPRFVFQGEPWEENWQGSSGYERPDPRARENLVDRLIVGIVTPLRPSRFRDPSYWRSYLPIVIVIQVMALIGLPIVAFLLIPAPAPAATGFTPTQVQRSAPRQGLSTGEPTACPNGSPVSNGNGPGPQSNSAVAIGADGDGRIYTVDPGSHIVISYYTGFRPSFSHGAPLCPAALTKGSSPSTKADYVASKTGTGFVYFPEPGGWAYVAEIDVVAHAQRYVPTYLLVITLAIVVIDIVLMIKLRNVSRSRSWPDGRSSEQKGTKSEPGGSGRPEVSRL
jgi:hypothetical protein